MKIYSIFLVLMLISCKVFAQKIFTGTVIYEILYEKADFDDNLKSSMPSELIVNYSEKYIKTKITNNIGSSIIIADSEDKSVLILLEINNSRYAIKNTYQMREKLLSERPETLIKFTDSIKSILGYKCKKAELYQGDLMLEVYYSDDYIISNDTWQPQFKDIKGLLLEYTQVTDNLKTRYIAKRFIKEKFRKKDFELPTDYKVITQDEFNKIMKLE